MVLYCRSRLQLALAMQGLKQISVASCVSGHQTRSNQHHRLQDRKVDSVMVDYDVGEIRASCNTGKLFISSVYTVFQ